LDKINKTDLIRIAEELAWTMHGKVIVTIMVTAMISMPWMVVSQDTISVGKTCQAQMDVATSQQVPMTLRIYDIEAICPKADYGELHDQACEQCVTKATVAADGTFIFCFGCPGYSGFASCSDVIEYVQDKAILLEAGASERRLQQPSSDAHAHTESHIVPRALQSYDANCDIDQQGASSTLASFYAIRYSCSACAGVPISVDSCCHDCYQNVLYAQDGQFVSCEGCESARSGQEQAPDAAKAARFSDRAADMDRYLRELITAASSSGAGENFCDATAKISGAASMAVSVMLLAMLGISISGL